MERKTFGGDIRDIDAEAESASFDVKGAAAAHPVESAESVASGSVYRRAL
jgi:hypothetical protein